MRLNFSNSAPEKIREGIRRLSMVVKAELYERAMLPVTV
jgi:DNA-binding transcriptional MocR family regulator